MADQVVSDAIPFPQDEGMPTVNASSRTWASAGHLMALAQAVDSGSYVRSDTEATFTGHDATNDTVQATKGIAYLDLSGEVVDVQSSLGGTDPPPHDTALPTLPSIGIELPSTTESVTVQDGSTGTTSSVWLAYATDGTVTGVSAGDVYLRGDDTGTVSVPPHPSVELGEANPDDSTADTLKNRYARPTFDATTVTSLTDGAANTISDFAGTNLSVTSGTLDATGASGNWNRNENTLADAGKAALLAVDQTTAKVEVIDETNDELSEWFLRGTNNDAQLLFDSNSHFTNTEDNDGTVNVYWDSTKARYEVNNETGGQITVAAIDVRET